MSDPDPADDRRYQFDTWPVGREDESYGYQYLGTRNSLPIVYDPDNHSVMEGRIEEARERIFPDRDTEEEIHHEDSLGEYLERVGDEHGWESLSEFAREHLEDNRNDS